MPQGMLDALVRFVRDSNEAATVEDLLRRALTVGMDVFRGWHGWIHIDHEPKPLDLRLSAPGLSANELDAVNMEEIRAEMLRRQTLVVHVPDSSIDAGGIGIPVFGGNGIVGSLVVLCEQGGEIAPAEIEYARLLGEQVALALERLNRAPAAGPERGPQLSPAAFRDAVEARLAKMAEGAAGATILSVGLVGFEGRSKRFSSARSDVLLRAAGAASAAALRSGDRVGAATDRVPESGPILHVLAEAADEASAAVVAERVLRALQSIPEDGSPKGPRLKGAIGGVMAPLHGTNAAMLLELANQELRRAAAAGAGHFCHRGSEARALQVVDAEIDSLLLSRVGRQALVMACRILERGFGTDGVASEALDLIGRAVRADRGLVMSGPEATTVLASQGGAGETDPPDFSRTFIRRAIAEGRPIFVENVETLSGHGPSESTMRLGIQSVICVPIESSQKRVGVLYLDRRTGGRFTSEDLRLAELFARRISRAVEQSILHAETTRKLSALEEVLDTRLEELSRRYRYGDIVGRSEAIQRVIRRIEQVKDLPYPIILQGPTGTGKELVAKAVHYNGARRTGPFVAVNCGAVPPTLVESEFFGHVKGAFTGATDKRHGYFELAQGGTLYLDEIEEMPEHLQVMLLRVLEEKKIRPIGGLQEVAVDVRVIASTNLAVGTLVESARLRKDLYYRLNGVTIDVPALAERREDIPLLVDHFLDAAAQELGEPKKAVSPRAMVALAGHAWPGNVRELKSEMMRLAAFARRRIELTDLPASIVASPRPEPAAAGKGGGAYLDARDAFDRDFLMKALETHGWKIAATAKATGLSRNGLKAKLRRLGIRVSEAE